MSNILGRGLDSLLSGDDNTESSQPVQPAQPASLLTPPGVPDALNGAGRTPTFDKSVEAVEHARPKELVYWVETAMICPNPDQPRRHFDEEKIQEMAESIRQYGMLQPIVVAKREIDIPTGTKVEYQIIAGERRYRAAMKLGLLQVPAIIRKEESEKVKLELALIENLQREDLNSIEKGLAYKRLMDDFKLTPREVGIRVGKSREAVANTVRLLALPEHMQAALVQGRVSEGQVRPLITLAHNPDEQQALFTRILTHGLSSRDVENEARTVIERIGLPASRLSRKSELAEFDATTRVFEERLAGALGTRVRVKRSKEGKGSISIEFFSDEEFQSLTAKIAQLQAEQAAAAAPAISQLATEADMPQPQLNPIPDTTGIDSFTV